MREKINAWKISMGTPEGKENAWKTKGQMKDDAKLGLKEIRWEGIDTICLA